MKKLILTRKNKNNDIVFNKQINILEDFNLAKEIGTENIKNEDSNLLIKSEKDLPIYDVIQIKINLTDVGTFLVNFKKENFSDDDRKQLIDDLTKLKDKQVPTIDVQTKKALKILDVVNKKKPIYVTFANTKEIKVDFTTLLAKKKLDFPLLILPQKKKVEKVKKPTNRKFPIFSVDYLFLALFSTLFSFSASAGTHELINQENLGIFLLILGALFIGISCFILVSLLIKEKNRKHNHNVLVLGAYSLVGICLGEAIGLVVSNFFLMNENTVFALGNIILFSLTGSILCMVIAIVIIMLIRNGIDKKKSSD